MTLRLAHVLAACGVASCLSIAACGSDTPEVELGSATVGVYTFDVAREGDAPTAGAHTRFVLKSTAGGNPTSVTGWVGVASGEGSVKTPAVFDPADGDYDDDVTVPSPLPSGAKFYFEVSTNGAVQLGSIDMK
jgi:hypothetical protein